MVEDVVYDVSIVMAVFSTTREMVGLGHEWQAKLCEHVDWKPRGRGQMLALIYA
jgi:hypothetical protein